MLFATVVLERQSFFKQQIKGVVTSQLSPFIPVEYIYPFITKKKLLVYSI